MLTVLAVALPVLAACWAIARLTGGPGLGPSTAQRDGGAEHPGAGEQPAVIQPHGQQPEPGPGGR